MRAKLLSNQAIRRLVARDVTTVRREAAVVLEITTGRIRKKLNPRPRMGVLAVIGPGNAFGLDFKRAVLCEVGLHESRPYHATKKPRDRRTSSETITLPKRHKWFSLNEQQYQRVAPEIFRQLQIITNRRVSTRKRGLANPHYIRTTKNFLRRGRPVSFSGVIYHKPACRFSVALTDRLLVSDLHHAELNSPTIQHWLRGAARKIDVLVRDYRRHGYKLDPKKLVGFQRAEETLRSLSGWLPKYLIREVTNYLPDQERNGLFREVNELVTEISGYNGDPSPERSHATKALPHPKNRLGQIDLRFITMRKYLRRNPKPLDHLAFEIYASAEHPPF